MGFLSITDDVVAGTEAKDEIPKIQQRFNRHTCLWILLQYFHTLNDALCSALCRSRIPGVDKVSETHNVLGCAR
jgi:hypothetical protein